MVLQKRLSAIPCPRRARWRLGPSVLKVADAPDSPDVIRRSEIGTPHARIGLLLIIKASDYHMQPIQDEPLGDESWAKRQANRQVIFVMLSAPGQVEITHEMWCRRRFYGSEEARPASPTLPGLGAHRGPPGRLCGVS